MFNLFKRKKRFMPLYNKIAADIASGKILTPDGNKFAKTTGYNYKTGARRFELWEKENGPIYLEDINPAWAEHFSIFLMDHGYCKNTIAVTLTRLKAVLNRLYNSGKSKYNGHGIRASNEVVTTVYSSVEDLRCLLDADFSETPGLERVRDIYILQCFVGLRYSDLAIVLADPTAYIREVGGKFFFEIKTRKTGEVVVIPVAQVVKQIMDKYGYNFGDQFSYQYYNLSIKNIARRAAVTQEVVFTRTEGGERVDTIREKCELMSSHTARRTFATNAFLTGLPEKNIMMITGHKTTASFHRYIRCSNMDAAIKIANHDFFNIELPISVTLQASDLQVIDSRECTNLPI